MGGEQEKEGEKMRRKGTICCGCLRLGQADCSPQTAEKTLSSSVCCRCLDVSKIRKLRLMVCLHFLSGVCTVAWFVQL